MRDGLRGRCGVRVRRCREPLPGAKILSQLIAPSHCRPVITIEGEEVEAPRMFVPDQARGIAAEPTSSADRCREAKHSEGCGIPGAQRQGTWGTHHLWRNSLVPGTWGTHHL